MVNCRRAISEPPRTVSGDQGVPSALSHLQHAVSLQAMIRIMRTSAEACQPSDLAGERLVVGRVTPCDGTILPALLVRNDKARER